MSVELWTTLGAPVSVTFRVVAVLLVCSSATAAPFQNLDFEQAVVSGPPGSTFPVAEALPHWTLDPVTGVVVYDQICLGQGCISVHDSGTTFSAPAFPSSGVPLEGAFSVVLQGPNFLATGPVYIEQVGDVTAGVIQLLFQAPVGGGTLEVSLNGTGISLTPVGTAGAATILRGDVSAFSGMTAALRISSSGPTEGGPPVVVDAVRFVPEPSTVLLLALGLVALTMRRRQPNQRP